MPEWLLHDTNFVNNDEAEPVVETDPDARCTDCLIVDETGMLPNSD